MEVKTKRGYWSGGTASVPPGIMFPALCLKQERPRWCRRSSVLRMIEELHESMTSSENLHFPQRPPTQAASQWSASVRSALHIKVPPHRSTFAFRECYGWFPREDGGGGKKGKKRPQSHFTSWTLSLSAPLGPTVDLEGPGRHDGRSAPGQLRSCQAGRQAWHGEISFHLTHTPT